MQNDFQREDDIIKSWFPILLLCFLAIMIRFCMVEKSGLFCEKVCEYRGEKLRYTEKSFWVTHCYCGDEIKPEKKRIP